VAIVYTGRAEGRTALQHARTLAEHVGAPLTVLTVASKERTDVGCGSCRQGMAFRNELACEFATEQLSEARDLLASAPAKVAVQYVLGRGSFTRAVIAVVEAQGADVIVLSGQRGGRLRRRVARDRAKLLRKRTSAAVIVAPDLAGR
jgi:nucleotide-binding universal stress UspA family protein